MVALSVIALHSCTDNALYTDSPCEVIITGDTYKAVFAEYSSVNQFPSLEAGSRILLNAFGSLGVENEVLTYSGAQWKGGNDFYWSETAGEAKITALYPVYDDLAYTKKNLYEYSSLEDVLYIHENYAFKEVINFRFKHLFSLLTLHLSEELQRGFEGIEVSSPVVVSQIVPETAEVVLDTGRSHSTLISTPTSSGDYSFIIPPAENSSIAVTIRTGGKQYTTQLQPRPYHSNEEYKYNLKTSEKIPGILTAEDWIAFSKLINSKTLTEYKGKMLKDFGETVDGVTTYRLLGNIDFAGVDCTELEQIKENKTFEDIFDGQGYTISNLTPKSGWGTTGLFAKIGTNGVVKNIHMKSCSTTLSTNPKSGTAAGILAGVNKGIIANCSIEDSELNTIAQGTPTGGLVGYSYGTIINCSIKKTTLKSKNFACGGIAGNSQGNIINCFSANNSITGTGTDTNSGGICGRSEFEIPTTITNCYVYALQVRKVNGGLFYGIAKNSIIDHCFYTTGSTTYASTFIGKGSNNQTENNFLYQPEFTVNSIPIYQLLNEWITDTAPTLYPAFTFTHWTSGGKDLPAIFI